jgi:hypothetical protein
VLHNGDKVRAVVNGKPYVVAVAGIEPAEIEARIPCHYPDTNENVDVAAANVWSVSEDIPL